MRKFKNQLLWLLAFAPIVSLSVLQSCKGTEEDTNPTISVSPKTSTKAPGESETYNIVISAPEGASSLRIDVSINGSTALNDTTMTLDGTAPGKTYTYEVASGAANNQTIDITFKVTDKKSQTAQTTAKITVQGSSSGNVKSYSNVTLGSFDNATGSFFNTSEGMVYTVAQAKANQAKVDFLYYYGAQNAATFAAPNDVDANTINTFQLSTWTTKNPTKLKKTNLDATAFANANTAASLEAAYTAAIGSEASQANALGNGSVVAFKTVAGKYGLIKLNSINGANSAGTASIDVKVQE